MKTIQVGSYSKSSKNFKPVKKPEPVLKQEIKNDKKNGKSILKKIFSPKVLIVVVILFVGAGAAVAYARLQDVNNRVERFDEEGNKVECTNILNPACWTDAFRPQLKQTDGFTNALVIGLDTRSNGKSSLRNTDSIIFLSFNHKTQKTMMISIPRDFYVNEYRFKINAVYALTVNKNKDDEWFYLKEMVGKIVGQPIHYFSTVHFDGVIEGIDKLGGVEVCPEADFTAQYPNDNAKPTDAQQWLFYDFKKGCQTVSGEMALVYARFRYIRRGPTSLASDFSRARRQQEVIEGVKEKLVNDTSSVGEKIEKYWGLLQSFSKSINVYGLTIEDIGAGLSFIDTADRDPINVVLDPAFGGINKFIYTDSSTSAGYTIRARDTTYKAIQAELTKIWDHADFFKEQPKILVRNMSEEKPLAKDHVVNKLHDSVQFYYFFNFINEKKTDKFSGIKIFDFTGGKKPGSLKVIEDYFGIKAETLPEEYGISRSKSEEDFLIVVGPKELPATPTPTVTSTP